MIEEVYRDKIMSGAEAAKLVKSGDRVYVGTASSFAYDMLDALWDRRDELEDVAILCSMSVRPSRMFSADHDGHNPFHVETFFLGAQERIAHRKHGMPLEFTCFHLSQIDLWCNYVGKPDVCFFQVSMPDENGMVSCGPSGGCMYTYLAENARNIVFECNAQVPYIMNGEKHLLPLSMADAIVPADYPVSPLAKDEVDDISQKISDLVMEEVPDGATIQLGLGKISTAVGY